MKLNYIQNFITNVNKKLLHKDNMLLMGENIDNGSKISGLARDLKPNSTSIVKNIGNCELTHCGVGLGMMLDGGHCSLFVKQIDFLLLGLDQICNTMNFIRAYTPQNKIGSFTIFAVVCDQGFQGPQSSLNNLLEFSSLANIPVFCINEASDCKNIIENQAFEKGFRIICLSQRMFNYELNETNLLEQNNKSTIFKYRSGSDGLIISMNFSLSKAIEIHKKLSKSSYDYDLFYLNYVPDYNFNEIIKNIENNKKVIVIDDSKSSVKLSDKVIKEILLNKPKTKIIEIKKSILLDTDYGVCEDDLKIDYNLISEFIGQPLD